MATASSTIQKAQHLAKKTDFQSQLHSKMSTIYRISPRKTCQIHSQVTRQGTYPSTRSRRVATRKTSERVLCSVKAAPIGVKTAVIGVRKGQWFPVKTHLERPDDEYPAIVIPVVNIPALHRIAFSARENGEITS